MAIIVTVLKVGKEYSTKHAQWLHSQLPKDLQSVCLSDADVAGVDTLPLTGNWPGWWSKLEIFNPELPTIGDQDLLFLDLDTVIVGDISPLLEVQKFTALTDFYREKMPCAPMASAVMYIPEAIKKRVWTAWLDDPKENMRQCNSPEKHGDQGFIGSVISADRWQDIMPGSIISYKKDIVRQGKIPLAVGNGLVPHDTRIVCFHGKPRPWECNEAWIPKIDI